MTSLLRGREEEKEMDFTEKELDVVIVGGSFAGLAAATQLGRARRKVAVVDAGAPRNRFAAHSHGFLTQDGKTPSEILATARKQLEAYGTVRHFEGTVTEAKAVGGGFELRTWEGQRFRARRIVLALGVEDRLPEVEGLAARWGVSVFHCPYCHAYEYRDLPLAVLGHTEAAIHQSVMIRDWSDDVVLFTNGQALADEGARAKLERRGVKIEEAPVARLLGEGKDLEAVELADGRRVARRGLLTATRTNPQGTLHEQLGCELKETPMGTMILVDARQKTSVEGVYAGGDAARFPHNVSWAVADGAMAGVGAHQSLLAEDWE